MKPLPKVETITEDIQSELVSFCNYVIRERLKLPIEHEVTHADVENWKNEKK